jgi:hypothetical protein
MYCRLPYVSRGVLSLKTLVLYIYRLRGTMQYNQQLYAIYYFYTMYHYIKQEKKGQEPQKYKTDTTQVPTDSYSPMNDSDDQH